MTLFDFNKQLLIKNKHILSIRFKGKSTAEYCLDVVKQNDYENFVCTILLKNTARSCALAIRSFNVEVARIAEQVSQETIGQMRLKFWEETVESCFSKDLQKVPHHPVAIELFKAISKTNLSKRYFNNLLSCRRNHFNLNGFSSLEELEKYAEQSVSNVYYLILEGSGVRNVNADHAASHLGKAQGIVQQLKILPLAKQLNLVPIPQDILIKNNTSQEEIIRGKPSKKLTECVYEVSSRAYQHLTKSRNLMKQVPLEARGPLLPAVTVFNYLDRLENVNYDIFHPSLQRKNFKWFAQLWWTHFKNKY